MSPYEHELHESNNFIYFLLHNGESAALRLLRGQRELAQKQGFAGAAVLASLEDSKSELSRILHRLEALELDVVAAMKAHQLTKEQTEQIQGIFRRNPPTLEELTPEDQGKLAYYWEQKKACIVELEGKGYTAQELFS